MKHKAISRKQKYKVKIPSLFQFHMPRLNVQCKTLGFTFLEDQISILWNTWVWGFATTLPVFLSFDFFHTYLIKLKKTMTVWGTSWLSGWKIELELNKYKLDLLQIFITDIRNLYDKLLLLLAVFNICIYNDETYFLYYLT